MAQGLFFFFTFLLLHIAGKTYTQYINSDFSFKWTQIQSDPNLSHVALQKLM